MKHKKPQVLIIQPIVPHYREPFFRLLAASDYIDVTVAYGEADKNASLQSISSGINFRTRKLKNLFYSPKYPFYLQFGLLSAIMSRRYDTIIACFEIRAISSMLAYPIARLFGIKWIWWGHGIGHGESSLSRKIRLAALRKSSALILYDAERGEKFISWGVPREKVFIAWNSIDMSDIESLRQEFTSDRYRILYIGRLIKMKKVDLAIQAFAKAVDRLDERIILTIIGDGPEKQTLIDLAADLNISNRVEFIGALYDQKSLSELFNTSLVSISPGGIGLSCMHSFGYGIPVIVADNEPHGPEFSAIKDHYNGRIFRSDDVEDFANTIIDMLVNFPLLSNMSINALKTISEKYNLANMASAFEDAVRYAHRKD
ncbi:glycosyltransferase family 4 protein [uncultured Desulfobulbus sp.]|uniref:glycosyltransferase family 4 protein n=1 Tax=uncultured Desulfobulbus sp. TaxID=239745 RepID=UPI0029C87DEF|nr:glycosyltransferase family 4 protein [uncultured Desulfobulbus sp.]